MELGLGFGHNVELEMGSGQNLGWKWDFLFPTFRTLFTLILATWIQSDFVHRTHWIFFYLEISFGLRRWLSSRRDTRSCPQLRSDMPGQRVALWVCLGAKRRTPARAGAQTTWSNVQRTNNCYLFVRPQFTLISTSSSSCLRFAVKPYTTMHSIKVTNTKLNDTSRYQSKAFG